MSKLSNWTDYNQKEREYIYTRDNYECVYCHSTYNLQVMHIFLSRAQMGHGVRQNGCLGCINCHSLIDNSIGNNNRLEGIKRLNYCKEYLIEKENIQDVDKLIKELRYKKW